MSAQRFAVLGAVEFSNACLQGILATRQLPSPHLVIGLHPDEAHRHSDYLNLARAASDAGVPAASVHSANHASTVALLRRIRIDVLLVLGWSEILGSETLGAVGRTVGSHPSMLPHNRGHHPLIWPLVLGLERTGLSFFELADRVDSGPLLWQSEVIIGPDDTARDLYDRASGVAVSGLRTLLPALLAQNLVGQPQAETGASYWRKRCFDDGRIDPLDTVRTAYNLVRALSEPYPGAHIEVRGRPVKVWQAVPRSVRPGNATHPGQVTEIDGGRVALRCSDAELVLLRHELDLRLIRVGDTIGVVEPR